MILEMPQPKDLREMIDSLANCHNSTTETLIKITEALNALAVWMKMQEGINKEMHERIAAIDISQPHSHYS